MGRNYEAHTCFHDPILGPYVVSSSSQKEEFFSKLLSSAATAGGAMSLFTGVGGGAGLADSASAGGTGRALLELTPYKIAVCHLVQAFAPPAQSGGDSVPPFPFESVAHHNRLGLFLFTLTRVRPYARLLVPPRNAALLMVLSMPCARYLS